MSDQSHATKTIDTVKKLLTYYREITDTITEPFLILDKGLLIVTANQAFYDTFKVTKLTTEGRMIYQLGDGQWDSLKLRELLENILPTHKFFNGFEVTHTFPKIGRRTMLLNARQIDRKQLILLAIQDISKQKKHDKDAAKLTESLLAQKDALESISDSKDEFISMASHQLRTPATAVKLYTSMLKEGYAGDLSQDQLALLRRAISNNDRQLEIIEDMLRVARTDAGKVYLEKTDCDLTDLLQNVIKDQLGGYISHSQKALFEVTGQHVIAYLDGNLMRMVFENLLDNASKYSRDDHDVTLTLQQTAQQTVITISDSGVGIDPSDQKRMFTKFSRLNNSMSLSTTGTGLGLYWVKKIVGLHEGSIKVISEVEQGSTFTITLPMLAPTPPRVVKLI